MPSRKHSKGHGRPVQGEQSVTPPSRSQRPPAASAGLLGAARKAAGRVKGSAGSGRGKPSQGGNLVGRSASADAPEAPLFLIHLSKSGTPCQTTTYVQHLRGESAQTSQSDNDVEKRLSRYGRLVGQLASFSRYCKFQKEHSTDMATVYDLSKRLPKLKACGSHLWFRDYYTHPDRPQRLSAGIFCNQRHYCPFCAARSAARTLQKWAPKISHQVIESECTPYMLTLTCRGDESLPNQYRNFWNAWDKVKERWQKSRKGRIHSPLSSFTGGVLAAETKLGKGSGLWHHHAHGVFLGPPDLVGVGRLFWREEGIVKGGRSYARGPLAEEWSNALGYEANCDLRPLASAELLKRGDLEQFRQSIAQDCLEVFKYALKTGELAHQARLEAAQFLTGKRLLRGYGSLHGVKDAGSGADDLDDLEAWPYVEMLYRFVEDRYVLQEQTAPQRVEAFDRWNEGA